MQIKNNHLKYLQNPWIIGFIKLVLLIACFYFIILKLSNQELTLSETVRPESFGVVLGLVIVLMILNWYLEALRWKLSIQPFEPINILKAWKIVLGGLTLNWILPFTSGDFLVRVSQQNDKYQATSAAFLNRGLMLFFTILIGSFGVSKIAVQYEVFNEVGLVLFLIAPILRWLFRKRLKRFFQYFKDLERHILFQIVLVSIARYLVFTIQFYLLLMMFLPALGLELLIAGIGWIFLVRSALPLLFGGVGVREASGIIFFESYVSDLQMVVFPIFLIWVINTVIPSLVGLIFILRFKANINIAK